MQSLGIQRGCASRPPQTWEAGPASSSLKPYESIKPKTRALENTLALERGPRTEPDAHLVRTDGIDDGLGDLEHKAYAILHRAAIQIRPRISDRLQKLVRKIAVRRVDLYAVEPGPEDRVPGRDSEQLHVLPDLFHRQRARHWRLTEWDRAGRHEREAAFFLKDIRGRGAPEHPELEEDRRPVFVNRIYDLPRRRRGRERDGTASMLVRTPRGSHLRP